MLPSPACMVKSGFLLPAPSAIDPRLLLSAQSLSQPGPGLTVPNLSHTGVPIILQDPFYPAVSSLVPGTARLEVLLAVPNRANLVSSMLPRNAVTIGPCLPTLDNV